MSKGEGVSIEEAVKAGELAFKVIKDLAKPDFQKRAETTLNSSLDIINKQLGGKNA